MNRNLLASLPAAAGAVALSVSLSNAMEIRHSEGARYSTDLTRAYEECTLPNDLSSDGIPACSPPSTSACDYNKGTFELIPNAPETLIKLRLNNVSGPGTCTTGNYGTLVVLRVTEDDAACVTGQCTVVDLPFVFSAAPGPHVAANVDLEDFLEAAIGVRLGHAANYEVLEVRVDGPDGLPIAGAGVGNHDAETLKSDVSARYASCTVPDTATVDAVPACSGPMWAANCDFTEGEVQLWDDGGAAPSVPTVLGEFTGTSGASPLCANGTYEIVSTLRLTGPVCSGNPCTLVDTQATIAVDAVDGVILDSATLATDGLAGPFDSIEVRDTFVRNPLAEDAASLAVTNAYLINKPGVTIKLVDTVNPADDRLSLKGAFNNPPIGSPGIDPGIDGATFSVTDQNGPVYTVTIPAGSWEVLKPGVRWRYKDDTASLGGVTSASIKVGAPGKASKFKLKARDLMLATADLPTVNLSFTVSSTDPATSHATRNAPCAVKATGRKCKL